MQSAFSAKETAAGDTPIFLFDIVLSDSTVLYWSSRSISWNSISYAARVLKHNLFDTQLDSDTGIGGVPKVAFEVANADSFVSEIESSKGLKGASVKIRLVFADVATNSVTSDPVLVFQGIANPPEQIKEDTVRLSALNRMTMQRAVLPEVRVQRMCPWRFPSTAAQRVAAVDGADRGRYSPLYRCGYSADQANGTGNMNGAVPFASCANTRSDCEARGMFKQDSSGRQTGRFGGIEYVPASTLVRGAGQATYQLSAIQDNQARYNDSVPLIYGTQWHKPDIVFSRNDGNLTRMEVLLGMGNIHGVLQVVVAGVEIPRGQAGVNMTSTGWYNIVNFGSRDGVQNGDFADSTGAPLGDPYGSMAYLSVVVPNRVSNGVSLPDVQVLVQGLKLYTFDAAGTYVDEVFTSNPAWVLLDVLLRSGWTLDELDKGSFFRAATYADELISVVDPAGGSLQIPRFQCNFALKSRVSAGEVIRSIRNSSRMYLVQNSAGLIEVRVENTFALQQSVKPAGSNAAVTFNGGWPAYEFDGSSIARASSGGSSVVMSSKAAADSPNRFSIEFQDSLNQYQQDSLSLADGDDQDLCKTEVAAQYDAAGVTTFSQAARVLLTALNKSIEGNRYITFETSVKALGLLPGDLITVTYQKEGLQRVPFRISRITPGASYRTAIITAQIHDDNWYSDSSDVLAGALGKQPGQGTGLPAPLAGVAADSAGTLQLGFSESESTGTDGSPTVRLQVSFLTPSSQKGSLAAPLLGFSPSVATSGGTLAGGRIYYYAVSSVDSSGLEGSRSFTVQAVTSASGNTNLVSLSGISLPSGSGGFHVYRGNDPRLLFRISSNVAPASSYTDMGLPELPVLAPDPEFDHANVYWRWEQLPETAVTGVSAGSISNSSLHLQTNQFAGATLRITSGPGAGQEYRIASNSSDTIQLVGNWAVAPSSASKFTVAESGWRVGCTSPTSPAPIDIPERIGTGVQVLVLAASVTGEEAPRDVSPVSRWVLGQSDTLAADSDVPPAPFFGAVVSARKAGAVELGQLSFPVLKNTTEIVSGTFKLHYFDEVVGNTGSITAALADSATSAQINPPPSAGSLIQIDDEILYVTSVAGDGTCQVQRGVHGSNVASHSTTAKTYLLSEQDIVVLFGKGFFGSTASGTWSYLVDLPGVRVASIELFVTNAFGNSPVTASSFTLWQDGGLRTLSGGQFGFQVTGYLAIQSGAAPDLMVDRDRSVGSISASLRGAADGTGVDLQLNLNGVAYSTLHFNAGATTCGTVTGFGLPILHAGDRISLDVTGVGSGTPGNDLTVVISL